MIIRGETSGAEATVISVDLISDEVGSLTGSFRVPDPTVSGNPKFETGRSTLRLTSNRTNSQVPQKHKVARIKHNKEQLTTNT